VYSQVLVKGLQHKVTVFIVTLVLLIGSFSLIPAGFIGFSFVPNTDQGMLTVTLDMDPQVTVFQNNQATMQAEKIISRLPEVERIYTNVGLSGSNYKK
jgi:Cation/multidrug efflux pump